MEGLRRILERLKVRPNPESAEMLRVVTASAPDAVIAVDNSGAVCLWNPAAERLFGYSRSEAMGKGIHTLIIPHRYRALHVAAFARFRESGAGPVVGKTVSLSGLCKDGTEFPLELSINAFQHNGRWHAVGIVRDIRERVEADRERNKLFRAVEHAPVSVVITNRDAMIEYVNPFFTELTGYTRQEVVGENPKVLKSGKQSREFYERMWNTLLSGQTWEGVFCNRKKNGEEYWERARIAPVFDEEGEITHFVAVKEDITELRQAEEALRNSEHRMRTMLEGLQIGVTIIDPRTHRIVEMNDAALKMIGLSREEVVGRICCQYFCPALKGKCPITDLHQSLDRSERTLMTADGREVPILKTVVPIELDGREHLLENFVDISNLKEVEKRLRKSQQRLQLALEGTGIGLWEMDYRTGKIFVYNDLCARMLGYGPEEIEPTFDAWIRLVHPDEREQAIEKGRASIKKDGFFRQEIRMRTADGGWKWIQSVGRVVERDPEGRTLRVIGIHMDMDERKRYESEIIEARRAAEHAAQAKAEFLANMSHEIRTPMNGVLGMAELLLDTELTAVQRGRVETIIQSAEALLNIINDVLEYSRIEAGKLRLIPVHFDLEQTVESTLRLLAATAGEKQVRLFLRYAPGTPRVLVGDMGRVRQILMNLVGNALKFTEEGYVFVDVECKKRDGGTAVIGVRVEDTGIGICREKVKEIFEAFTQADASVTRRFGGTGLGLAISRHLVEAMGGRIEVSSEWGRGTTVRFSLSLALPEEPDEEVFRPWEEPWGVLLLGEHPLWHRILAEQLESWNLHVRSAFLEEEALKILRAGTGDAPPFRAMMVECSEPLQTAAVQIRNTPEVSSLFLVGICYRETLCDTEQQGEQGYDECLSVPLPPSRLYRLMTSLWEQEKKGAVREKLRVRAAGEEDPGPCSSIVPRILLAEDNALNREVAVGFLQSLGCWVDVAENGCQAVDMAVSHEYDLIFMDVQMPEMDGFTATAAIREREGERRVPIVAMTAHAMADDRRRCLEAGMDDYISKPLRRQALESVLSRQLGHPIRRAPEHGRVLVVEPDEDLRKELRAAFQSHLPGLRIRTARNAVEAYVQIGSFLPDFLVVDPSTPRMDLEALLEFVRKNPRYADLRILLWLRKGEEHSCPEMCSDSVVATVIGKPDVIPVIRRIRSWKGRKGRGFSPIFPSQPRGTDAFPRPQVFDRDTALHTADGNIERLRKLAAILAEDLPLQVRGLREALSSGDVPSVVRRAHTIKGQAAHVGAERLRRAAWEAERMGEEGRLDEVERKMDDLAALVRELVEALKSENWDDLERGRKETP